VLTYDLWNPDDTRFPPDSFIAIGQLHKLFVQWAFGDVLPPLSVERTVQLPDEIGWL
jgi:hypothetical protein